MEANDMPCILVPLLELKPWLRKMLRGIPKSGRIKNGLLYQRRNHTKSQKLKLRFG